MKIYNKGSRAYRRVFKDAKGYFVHHLSGKTLDYPKEAGERMLKNHAKELERVDGGEKRSRPQKKVESQGQPEQSTNPAGTDEQDNA